MQKKDKDNYIRAYYRSASGICDLLDVIQDTKEFFSTKSLENSFLVYIEMSLMQIIDEAENIIIGADEQNDCNDTNLKNWQLDYPAAHDSNTTGQEEESRLLRANQK